MSATHAAAPAHTEHHELGFLRTYVFSTDHKMIGKQYLALGVIWALIGGLFAGAMRWQLAWPDTAIPLLGEIGPDTYNMLVTMHGTIMVFFVISLALVSGFGNFLIPLHLGARDMAYPFLNALSYWTVVPGCLLMILAFFAEGGAAAAGWTAYPPLSALAEAVPGSGLGQTLWLLAMALFIASFTMSGLNYITTVLNCRARGMGLMQMPLSVWFFFVSAILGVLTVYADPPGAFGPQDAVLLGALADMQRQGNIRRIGVSNVGFDALTRARRAASPSKKASMRFLSCASDTTRAAWDMFTQALVRTNRIGADNIQFVTGVPFTTIVGRWALANFVENLDTVPGFTPPAELQYRSWNLRSVYQQLNAQNPSSFPQRYPLAPTSSQGSAVDVTGTLRAGSGIYHRVLHAAGAPSFVLTFRAADGWILAPTHNPRLNVIRIR